MSQQVQPQLPITDTAQVSTQQETAVKPQAQARKTFTRPHTAEADKQVRALCRSIAKAGKPDEANYLLHHWFPRKSSALIARAYEASKSKGSRIILDMLAFEDRQLKHFGSWDQLPRNVREALS